MYLQRRIHTKIKSLRNILKCWVHEERSKAKSCGFCETRRMLLWSSMVVAFYYEQKTKDGSFILASTLDDVVS